jgi:hypothetical protein
LPSNDFFIGNDAPTAYRLFDAAGNLQIGSINQSRARSGTPAARSSIPRPRPSSANNGLHSAQNSVVAFNFAELAASTADHRRRL